MKLKQTFAVIGIAAIMAATVQAETPQPATTAFTAADVALLFEQDTQPRQLLALSEQEMKATEGAWGALGAVAGGVSGLAGYTTATMISGEPWSWGEAALRVGSGALYGAGAGPAGIIWGFNGHVTEGAIEGMIKRYPW